MIDSRTATERAPSPEAIEFVRFCYRRRRVGWPDLYDEMCAVASRGLFRGWGSDELGSHGIGFSLFELPALAALVGRVIDEEQERRRLTQVQVAQLDAPDPPSGEVAAEATAAQGRQVSIRQVSADGPENGQAGPALLQLAGASAGA